MYKITDEHKDRNSNNNNEDNNDNELSELNDINNTNDMNNITSKPIYQCGNNENTGEDSLITFSPRNHSKSRVSNTFKLSEISNIQNSLYNASNNNISLINNINSDNDLNFINSYSHNQSKSVLKETEDNYTVNTLNNNSDNEKKKDKKVKYLSTVTLLDSEKESSYNLSHLSCFNSENDEKNKVVKFNLNNMLEHSKKNKADMGRYVNEEHDKINFSNLVLDDEHNKKNDTDRTSRTNKTNMTNMTNMSNSKYSKHSKHSKHSKESCFRSISAKTSNAELEYSQTITEDKNTINTERSNNSIVIETIKRMNSNIISEGLKDYLIQNINSGENKLTSNNRILNDKRKSIINAKNTQGFIKSSKKRSYSVFKKPSSSGLSGFGSILDYNKHSKNNSKEKYSNKNDNYDVNTNIKSINPYLTNPLSAYNIELLESNGVYDFVLNIKEQYSKNEAVMKQKTLENEELISMNYELIDKLRKLREHIQNLSTENSHLDHQIKSFFNQEETIYALENEIETYKKSIDSKNAMIHSLQRNYENQVHENEKLKVNALHIQEENNNLLMKLENLRKICEQADKYKEEILELKKIEQEALHTRQVNATLRKDLDTSYSQFKSSESKIEMLKKECYELREQIKIYKMTIIESESEIGELKFKLLRISVDNANNECNCEYLEECLCSINHKRCKSGKESNDMMTKNGLVYNSILKSNFKEDNVNNISNTSNDDSNRCKIDNKKRKTKKKVYSWDQTYKSSNKSLQIKAVNNNINKEMIHTQSKFKTHRENNVNELKEKLHASLNSKASQEFQKNIDNTSYCNNSSIGRGDTLESWRDNNKHSNNNFYKFSSNKNKSIQKESEYTRFVKNNLINKKTVNENSSKNFKESFRSSSNYQYLLSNTKIMDFENRNKKKLSNLLNKTMNNASCFNNSSMNFSNSEYNEQMLKPYAIKENNSDKILGTQKNINSSSLKKSPKKLNIKKNVKFFETINKGKNNSDNYNAVSAINKLSPIEKKHSLFSFNSQNNANCNTSINNSNIKDSSSLVNQESNIQQIEEERNERDSGSSGQENNYNNENRTGENYSKHSKKKYKSQSKKINNGNNLLNLHGLSQLKLITQAQGNSSRNHQKKGFSFYSKSLNSNKKSLEFISKSTRGKVSKKMKISLMSCLFDNYDSNSEQENVQLKPNSLNDEEIEENNEYDDNEAYEENSHNSHNSLNSKNSNYNRRNNKSSSNNIKVIYEESYFTNDLKNNNESEINQSILNYSNQQPNYPQEIKDENEDTNEDEDEDFNLNIQIENNNPDNNEDKIDIIKNPDYIKTLNTDETEYKDEPFNTLSSYNKSENENIMKIDNIYLPLKHKSIKLIDINSKYDKYKTEALINNYKNTKKLELEVSSEASVRNKMTSNNLTKVLDFNNFEDSDVNNYYTKIPNNSIDTNKYDLNSHSIALEKIDNENRKRKIRFVNLKNKIRSNRKPHNYFILQKRSSSNIVKTKNSGSSVSYSDKISLFNPNRKNTDDTFRINKEKAIMKEAYEKTILELNNKIKNIAVENYDLNQRIKDLLKNIDEDSYTKRKNLSISQSYFEILSIINRYNSQVKQKSNSLNVPFNMSTINFNSNEVSEDLKDIVNNQIQMTNSSYFPELKYQLSELSYKNKDLETKNNKLIFEVKELNVEIKELKQYLGKIKESYNENLKITNKILEGKAELLKNPSTYNSIVITNSKISNITSDRLLFGNMLYRSNNDLIISDNLENDENNQNSQNNQNNQNNIINNPISINRSSNEEEIKENRTINNNNFTNTNDNRHNKELCSWRNVEIKTIEETRFSYILENTKKDSNRLNDNDNNKNNSENDYNKENVNPKIEEVKVRRSIMIKHHHAKTLKETTTETNDDFKKHRQPSDKRSYKTITNKKYTKGIKDVTICSIVHYFQETRIGMEKSAKDYNKKHNTIDIEDEDHSNYNLNSMYDDLANESEKEILKGINLQQSNSQYLNSLESFEVDDEKEEDSMINDDVGYIHTHTNTNKNINPKCKLSN